MTEINSKNKVEGSNNNTAGRDIINNNRSPWDDFIFSQLSDFITPELRNQATIITETIGTKIHEILESEILLPFKEEVRKINLQYHLSEVQKVIEHTKEKYTFEEKRTFSKSENIKRMESFLEWVEEVENISIEEEELSKIWHGWFMSFNTGDNIHDLNLILKAMKKLTTDEALLLFYLNRPMIFMKSMEQTRGEDLRHTNRFQSSNTSKINYLYDLLLEKKLIEPNKKNKTNLYIAFISLILILLFSIISPQFGGIFETKSYSAYVYVGLLCATITSSLHYFIWNRIKYVRTWMGDAIVKYARQADELNS